jgi:hypothetical protein
LLLKSEAHGPTAFAKCCAKGKVKMASHFYKLQRPFLRPGQRIQEDEAAHNLLDDEAKELDMLLTNLITGRHRQSSHFLGAVAQYNSEMAFGTATTQQQPVPGGYQPVKMNGMVTYRLSGINPPDDPVRLNEICGQVWTLNPDEAIALRQQRNVQQRLHLSVIFLLNIYQFLYIM